MKYIKTIGVGIGLILLCRLASTPINNYLYPIHTKIDIESQTVINFTPKPVKIPIIHEKYPEVRAFLDQLPDCEWCTACGSYARYTRLEGEKYGFDIKEYKINAKLDTGTMTAGHQLNTYRTDNNHLIYIDNTGNSKDIIEPSELKQYILNRYNQII